MYIVKKTLTDVFIRNKFRTIKCYVFIYIFEYFTINLFLFCTDDNLFYQANIFLISCYLLK